MQKRFEFSFAATEQNFWKGEPKDGQTHRGFKCDNAMPSLLGNEESVPCLHPGIEAIGFGKICAHLRLLREF